MNESSQPKTPQIREWIAQAAAELSRIGIDSAKLDAELILAHTLRKSRTYLHAYSDTPVDPMRRDIADARLQLRLERTPLAYIIGHKEFYGRLFHVTPATLIPRPESETIIELLKEWLPRRASHYREPARLVDVGTGSGCLGITAKLEFPELDVALLDISRHALTIARKNALHHHLDVTIQESNLLDHYPLTVHVILANLPYVDPTWQRSPETDHEPPSALFADEHGLHLIDQLITQASHRLASRGLLFLEADPRQHEAIIARATHSELVLCESRGFVLCFEKPNSRAAQHMPRA